MCLIGSNMRVFEIYNDDIEEVELVTESEEEVYDFFLERLGEVDAQTLWNWATEAKPGHYWWLLPCTPYKIECKEK